MFNFVVNLPVKIIFGRGELAQLATHVKTLGDRAYLLSDPFWANAGVAEKLVHQLNTEGIETGLYPSVDPNPKCEDVEVVGAEVRRFGAKFVIGLGGGSAIDMAKAVAVAATHSGPVSEFVNWNEQPRQVTDAVLPIVAIPSTAGTGAEVTQAAVMFDPVNYRKTAIFSERLYPRLAVVDPDLSASMPPGLTAATGLDALCHAMEGILNTQKRSPFVDIIGLDAIARIHKWLPKAYVDGQDMEARTQMAWAAVLGGMSIALSGTTVPHALAQPLGARLNVHHGLSIAVFLPAILAKSWEADPPLFARIACAMGVPDQGLSVGARARSVAGAVRHLITQVGLDKEIAKINIDPAMAQAILNDATSYLRRLVDRHIQPFHREELFDIIKDSVVIKGAKNGQ